MDLIVNKLYKGTEDILKGVLFRVAVIHNNGIIDIVTVKPFEHKMSFGSIELKETMKIVELP